MDDPEEETPLIERVPKSAPRTRALASRGRLVILCCYSIGWSALWTFILVVALPHQVQNIVGNLGKGRALGGLMVAGGIVSIVEPPLVGYLSDRTASPFGRRRPYIFCGSILLAVCVLLLPYCRSMTSLTLTYVAVQIFSNVSSSCYLGLIPDIIPHQQLGAASGAMGALSALGQLIGSSAGVFVGRIGFPMLYTYLSALHLVMMCVTVFSVVEEQDDGSLQNIPRVAGMNRTDPTGGVGQRKRACLEDFFSTVVSNADFRWVVLTRLFYNMGIYSVQEFLQYFVADVLRLKGWSPSTEVAALFVPLLLGGLVSAYVNGYLSDRWGGRRKIFIYVAGGLQAVICILLGFTRRFEMALILSFLFGMAYGAFSAIDFAMVCDVLPNSRALARDLGIWHTSLIFPQLLATPIAGA